MLQVLSIIQRTWVKAEVSEWLRIKVKRNVVSEV